MLVLLSTLTGLILYFAGHNNSQEASWATFTNEFGYWGPVLIFCVPGLLLVFHGKRMMRCTSVSLLELVEVLAAIVTTIAIFLLVLR